MQIPASVRPQLNRQFLAETVSSQHRTQLLFLLKKLRFNWQEDRRVQHASAMSSGVCWPAVFLRPY
jgi:hypothetical protein